MVKIFPVRVISPVMAMSGGTDRPSDRDKREVTMVQPADGPSFGVAPSGMCM